MTETLHLTLLGKPQVTLGGVPISGISTAKAQALLYYLAVTGRPHSRESLVELLWGEMPEAKAKRNLTTVLTNLRKLLAPYLLIEAHTITFNQEAPHYLDVAEFQNNIEMSHSIEDLTPLREAAELYQGDFLEGLHVKNALSFEDWALTQREQLREQAIDVFEILAVEYTNRAEYSTGIHYATRLLELDPWRESGHRQMMILLARSGQRSAALIQYETCRKVLADELGVEPSPETTALYERLKSAGTTPTHNLPSHSNTFVGRKVELNQIATHLNNPNCRLLTIVGPGGIGKTRLALEGAARYLKPEMVLGETGFTDGIFFMNLTSISVTDNTTETPDDPSYLTNVLLSAIADTLNFSFHGPTELITQLLNYLSDKEMLLVLDNFEHLIEEAALLVDILQNVSGVKLLVTSRERLNLQEEWVMEIEGLEYPETPPDNELLSLPNQEFENREDKQAVSLELKEVSADLERYSAIALFVQQAQQVYVGFVLTETETPHVIRICQLTGGVPLALMLAASWLRVLTCAEIVAEIEQNLDFLETSLRNVPKRHRSLRAIFEQSWQMLTKQETLALCKLSIFRGGFQRDAAQTVAETSLSTLIGLVDKSLIRHDPSSGRYDIHELLRQYASEKLWFDNPEVERQNTTDHQIAGMSQGFEAMRDSIQGVWQRYSTYYLDFVSSQEPHLRGQTLNQATLDFRKELDNVRRAWHWAVTDMKIDDMGRSIIGLSRFYDITNLFQEGETVFHLAADQVQAFLSSSRTPERDTQILLCRLLAEKAHFLNRRGLSIQAIQITQSATDMALEIQSEPTEALARHQWGYALMRHGEYEAAYTQLNQALQLARSNQLPNVEAEALDILGIVVFRQGNYAEARVLLEQAQRHFNDLENQRAACGTLLHLGNIARRQGDYSKSRVFYEEALQGFREAGDRWGESKVLNNLGMVFHEEGDYSEAQIIFDQAFLIARELQDYTGETDTLHNLGNLSRDQGDYSQAQLYYEQCIELSRKIGNLRNESYALADLGLLYHYLGDNKAAHDYSRQALHIAQNRKARTEQALALTHLGHALGALGSLTEASNAYQEALQLGRELGEPRWTIAPLTGLTHIYLTQGNPQQAQTHTEEILLYLKTNGLSGMEEPFWVYLTCYRVLQAIQDSRAQDVLKRTHTLLHERAANIEDIEIRQSFLENVPAHREIISEFERQFS